MSIAYANISDCVDVIPSLADVNEHSARLEAMLIQSLLDASRLIETDLMMPVDYFAPAGSTFSSKTFYHNGTRYIRLRPYTIVEFVQDADENFIDSDEYRLNDDFDPYDPSKYYLKWNYRNSCGNSRWWAYSPITMSAKWGFPCIPPDIVMAVKNMGALMFLNNPLARVGLNEEGLTDNQEQRMRTTYNRVMSAWSDKLHHYRNLGIA